MAFPEGRTYAVEITIDHTLVSSDLTDKPIRIPLSALPSDMVDADGGKAALNGGGDILAYASDRSTRLSLEVVYFVTDNNPASAEAELWVKVPTVSSATDTVIVLVWGKTGETQPARGAAYGMEDVWSNGFYNVWHLGESSGSTANESTAQLNHGTYQGSIPNTTAANGVRVQDCDGSGDYVTVTQINQAFSPGFTIESITRFDDVSGADAVALGNDGAGSLHVQTVSGSYKFYFWFRGSNPHVGSQTVVNSTWYCKAVRRDNSNVFDGRLNGADDTGVPSSSTTRSGNCESIEQLAYNTFGTTRELDGDIDEVQVSDNARSDAWIDTTYQNTLNAGSFLSTGSVESLTGGAGLFPFFIHQMAA